MTSKTKRNFQLTGKTMILCLLVWFVACLISYVIIYIWENNRKKELIKIGVAISKDISSQSGLLVLERNINFLSRLIEKAKEKPEVIFASIIDHKNKLIAYTDQDQFFTLNRQKSNMLENVRYWRIPGLNHQNVMNFSAEITFSGTRIGEVFISLAVEKIGHLKRLFFLAAIFSLLGILILYGAFKYNEFFAWFKALNAKFKFPGEIPIEKTDDPEFSCPMCGRHAQFSLNDFHLPDLEKFPVLKQYPDTNSSVLLQDMTKKGELKEFKRLIIVQCTKIIDKISAE